MTKKQGPTTERQARWEQQQTTTTTTTAAAAAAAATTTTSTTTTTTNDNNNSQKNHRLRAERSIDHRGAGVVNVFYWPYL